MSELAQLSVTPIMSGLKKATEACNDSSLPICVNGDWPSQWEMANFDPSQNRNPFRIPYWVFKECADELCVIISVLINFSINEGCVPSVWKHHTCT